MKKISIILFLVAFLFESAFGQENPFIKNYTIHEGLPTNKIIHACQDSDGFIWFTTYAGVVRFDGKNFVHFSMDDGLSDNMVFRIKEDNTGRLWFMNRNGTVNFYQNNTIYNENNTSFLNSLKSDFYIIDFFQDEDSTLYFYNNVSEVFVVKNDEFVDYRNFGFNNPNYIGGLQYFNKSLGNNFSLWTSQGIFQISDIDDSLQIHLQPVSTEKVFPLSKNECISLDRQGFIHLHNNTNLVKKNIVQSETKHVNTINFDQEGLIWVGTYDKGVYCYRDDSLLLNLEIKQIQNILIDNENNIWITSDESGIYKINRSILDYYFINSDSFLGKGLKDLAPAKNQNMLATNGSFLFIIHNKKSYPVKQKINCDILNNIYQLKNNTVITNGPGTNMFLIENVEININNNSVTHGSYIEWFNYRIKDITVDSNEDFIFSFLNDDILFLERTDGKYLYYVGNLNKGRINSIFYTNKNELVVNTTENYKIVLDSLKKNKLVTIPNETFELLNGKIISSHLKIDSDNELFNVQDKNIYLLNNQVFYEITKEIRSQIDYRIIDMAYADSTLFFFTAKTLYYISNPCKIINNKPIKLNRLNIEFNNINDIICQDNTLHIASDDGLTYIPIEDCVDAMIQSPKSYFNKVFLDDIEYDFSSNMVELKNNNRLSIEFASLNFSSFPSNYSYMLEGIENNWIQGDETRVVYLNLSPGNYTFKLRSRKNTEEYGKTIELPIIVHPTFFQRTATKIILILLSLTIISLIILLIYKNQIRKKETESQLTTLEHKALQSMMNPHFIFNSLGSIQRYLLQNKAVEASTYLSQFARLIRQNMNSLRSNFISVEDEIERLRNYIELEKFRMDNKFDFIIEVDNNLDGDEIGIPSMIVQPFIENAIWHGVSTLPVKGKIKVSFNCKDEKSITIIIEDNGVGINKTEAFSKSGHNLNMGVSITERRLNLIGQKIGTNAGITYEELIPGTKYPGTKVILTVPILT